MKEIVFKISDTLTGTNRVKLIFETDSDAVVQGWHIWIWEADCYETMWNLTNHYEGEGYRVRFELED